MPRVEEIDLTTPAGRAAWEGQQKRQKRDRATRPDIPSAGRAARGDGDRLEALATLAAAGYCYFEAGGGAAFRFRHAETGTWTPVKPTYREAVDAALAEAARAAVKGE